MTSNTEEILSRFSKVLGGFVALQLYRFLNFCVKAEPAALLSVTVWMKGEEHPLEDASQVGIRKEDEYTLLPLDESYLPQLMRGMVKAHPEFKMKVGYIDQEGMHEIDEDKDEEEEEGTKHILFFTVPEVNDERHDLLTKAIDACHDDCKLRLETNRVTYLGKLTVALRNEDPSEADDIKQLFNDIYDQHVKLCNEQYEAKLEEIEKAYQRYIDKRESDEQLKAEQQQVEGESISFRMNMFAKDDDE